MTVSRTTAPGQGAEDRDGAAVRCRTWKLPVPRRCFCRNRQGDGKVKNLPFLVIVLSLLLFLGGLNLGEPAFVWERAVRICLSCIGIG